MGKARTTGSPRPLGITTECGELKYLSRPGTGARARGPGGRTDWTRWGCRSAEGAKWRRSGPGRREVPPGDWRGPVVGQSSESSKTGAALVVRPTSESASLVGSHPSCCQVQSWLVAAGDAGRRVTGLLIQTACTPAEGLQLEQRGRAQSGAAASQLSESNLRGFPRA